MSDVIDFYTQHACASPLPWLAQLQAEAIKDFQRLEFPTRANEHWKYTSLDPFLSQRFNSFIPEEDKTRTWPTIVDQSPLVIHNGQYIKNQILLQGLPSGIIITTLCEALTEHEALIKPYLGQFLKHEHGFQALNTAAFSAGLFIFIPKHVQLKAPLILIQNQSIAHQAVHTRNLIIMEEGSSAEVVQYFQGEGESYLNNTITEVQLRPLATLSLYEMQCASKQAFHIHHTVVNQARASQFNSHIISLGSQLARSDVTIHLQEENAACLLNGIYMPGNKQHIDHHTTIHHAVANCRSQQDYKGVLAGSSRAVFNGAIVVAKNAFHSEAQQQNKNLLLSSSAEIDTKPQLEIFADDVSCTHGATVGQVDEDSLFYLQTRGFERETALHYLIHAFAGDNLRLIANRGLAEWVSGLMNQQLKVII